MYLKMYDKYSAKIGADFYEPRPYCTCVPQPGNRGQKVKLRRS